MRVQLYKKLTKERQDVVKLGNFSYMNKISEWMGRWRKKFEKGWKQS